MGGHGKGWLRIAIEDWLKTGTLAETIGGWLSKGIEWSEEQITETHGDLFDAIPEIKGLDPELQPKAIMKRASEHQGGVLSLAGFGASMGMGAASSLLAPIFRQLNYAMDKTIESARVDPPVAFAMAMREPGLKESLDTGLRELGWDDDLRSAWFNIVQPRPSEGDLIALELREVIGDTELDTELKARGWAQSDIDNIRHLAQVIPGIQDLVHMAVREAWRDDVAARFQYDVGFGGEWIQWAKKLGLSEDWCKRYWRAHWVIPGIREGFEMLHRLRPGTTDNPFTEADLETMLTVADIPAFFRDRLKEVGYYPLTRVDVRRMYGLGVLDRDEVKANYLDLGYNDLNAERMTEFTVRFEKQEQRDLTRSVIVSAYERKVMPRGEAYSALQDIGYDDDDADLFLLIADTKLIEQTMKAELDRLEFLFVEGMITETDVYTELGRFNLSADQQHHLFTQWTISRLKKISLATKSELEDLYKRDIIDRDAFKEGLIKRRYDEETIGWYTERLDQRVAEDASKEVERAQKEEERVLKAELATNYQKMKAAIDVVIASLRLEIADIKLAINYMVDPKQVEQAKTEILARKVEIADAQLAKAEFKYGQLGEIV